MGIFITKEWIQKTHGDNRFRRLSVLFQNILEIHGKFIASHAWIYVDHDELNLNMERGDKIRFLCKEHRYYKGKHKNIKSYGLKAFRNAKKINRLKLTLIPVAS